MKLHESVRDNRARRFEINDEMTNIHPRRIYIQRCQNVKRKKRTQRTKEATKATIIIFACMLSVKT